MIENRTSVTRRVLVCVGRQAPSSRLDGGSGSERQSAEPALRAGRLRRRRVAVGRRRRRHRRDVVRLAPGVGRRVPCTGRGRARRPGRGRADPDHERLATSVDRRRRQGAAGAVAERRRRRGAEAAARPDRLPTTAVLSASHLP